MHLLKFPLDSQVCPLWIGSYGYASNDLLYEWRKVGSISIGESSDLAYASSKLSYRKVLLDSFILYCGIS